MSHELNATYAAGVLEGLANPKRKARRSRKGRLWDQYEFGISDGQRLYGESEPLTADDDDGAALTRGEAQTQAPGTTQETPAPPMTGDARR